MNPGAGDSGGDDNGSDGRKGGKRELSTSKRAAQNRAAQVCDCGVIVDWSEISEFKWVPLFLGDKGSLLNSY